MADNEKATEGAVKPTPNQQGQETPKEEKKVLTLTEEELEKRLQAEADKRVSSALKTAEQKWKATYEERIKEERQDAERLAKMSEEEKQREIDKKREEQLSFRERTLHRKEMELEAVKILDEKKLPVKFASMLIGDTPEETLKNIDNFSKEWLATFDERVNDRLKGSSPQADASKGTKKLDMNDIIRSQAKRR